MSSTGSDGSAEPLMEFELIDHTQGIMRGRATRPRAPVRSARHDPAPDLPLRAPDGRPHSLADFRGQNVVLHIFDKDETNATRHARSLQQHLAEFQELNAQVLGAAPAGPRAQRRFAKKNRLDFMLLADKDRRLAQELGATGNATIIIDRDGRIDKVYTGDGRAERDTDRVLRHLRALRREEEWHPGAAPPE